MMDFNIFIEKCNEKLQEFKDDGYKINRTFKFYEKQYICNYVRYKKEIIVAGRLTLDDLTVVRDFIDSKEMYILDHMELLAKIGSDDSW